MFQVPIRFIFVELQHNNYLLVEKSKISILVKLKKMFVTKHYISIFKKKFSQIGFYEELCIIFSNILSLRKIVTS